MIIAIGFTFLLNGRLGVYLTAVMIFAFITSLLMMLYVRNKISMTVTANTQQVNKGDKIEITFELTKKSFIPTPFIEVTFSSTEHVVAETPESFRIALGPTKSQRFKINYNAVYTGQATIMVSSVKLIDYLGLSRIDIMKNKNLRVFDKAFGVIPVIHDVSGQNELLRICCDATAFDDDAEETEDVSVNTGGIVGFEHREYVPGDQIKRINWKLSSKKDVLMVRLDEKLASTSQSIVFCNEADFKGHIRKNDRCIEAVLAMLALMLRQGLDCNVYMMREGIWTVTEVSGEEDLLAMQSFFADYHEPECENRLPIDLMKENKSSAVMCFSGKMGSCFFQDADFAKTQSIDIFFVIPQDEDNAIASGDFYYVDNEFNFKHS